MTRGGRVLFGLNGRYRIERWDPGGSVFVIERTVNPVPAFPEEESWARGRITRMVRRGNQPSWSWDGPDIPSRCSA